LHLRGKAQEKASGKKQGLLVIGTGFIYLYKIDVTHLSRDKQRL